jgi:hypothetical protein
MRHEFHKYNMKMVYCETLVVIYIHCTCRDVKEGTEGRLKRSPLLRVAARLIGRLRVCLHVKSSAI